MSRRRKNNASLDEKVKDYTKMEFAKKVMILNEELLSEELTIQRFQHPGSALTALFAISKKTKSLFEVFQFDQPHRSWFIDQSVSSDGKCYMVLPFDILFLVLYHLRKNCTKQAIPLDQWEEREYPNTIPILCEFVDDSMLEVLSDVKRAGDIVAYKYNNKKSLAWLALKVKSLVEALKEKSIYSGSSAISANYTKSEKIDPAENDEYLKYACGMMGAYIQEDLYDELLLYFSIEKENPGAKRKSMQPLDLEHPSKKVKLEEGDTPPPKEKEKKVSTKEKALAKAAKGSKSISSFFKK